MDPIVIIGTGLAGYTTARELRKLEPNVPLVLISADRGEFYSKPMLSNALAQGRTAEQIPTANHEQMAAQLSATLRTQTRVIGFDSQRQQVHLEAEVLAYSRLVLAVGATPIAPPLAGEAASAVWPINNLDDYRRFRAALGNQARTVAIIGAGLIGCEFANDLRTAGHAVTVIGRALAPLDRLVPEAVGMALRDALAAQGVIWRLGTEVTRVDPAHTHPPRWQLTLTHGPAVVADLVLSCIGLQPHTTLAYAAGLAVERGIVVDRFLRTRAAHVYALGDCAQVEGWVLPYVMPLMNCARALAKTLAGEPTAVSYPPMPVVVKTPAHPIVTCPPPPGLAGTWQVATTPQGVKALFHDTEQALRGYALSGACMVDKTALTKQLPLLF